MEAPTLSVLSWNLFGSPIAPEPLVRMRRAATIARDAGTELVLFQEVWSEEQRAVIDAVLGEEYALHHSGAEARWIVGLAGGLLACVRRDSRWKLMAEPAFVEFGDEASEWFFWQGDGLADKGVQSLRLRDAKTGLVAQVLNTHLQSDYRPALFFDFSDVRRVQIADLTTVAKRHDVPTLAFGDLNFAPDTETHREMLADWDDLSARERERCGCGTHGDASTWIDYVLGRSTEQWAVRADVERGPRERTGAMISDHNPLTAQVRFEAKPGRVDAASAAALVALAEPSTRRTWLLACSYLASAFAGGSFLAPGGASIGTSGTIARVARAEPGRRRRGAF